MIVSTELRDCLNEMGEPAKQLVLSYINKEGKISYLTYIVPKSQMYQWKYAKRGEPADANYTSWDGKPVIKVPVNGYLNDNRLHEIILDLIKQNPQVAEINTMYEPDISFCDIEVDVDDNGFPEAETAHNPINTISWVHNEDVIVFGRCKLSAEQIASIQRRITEHTKKFSTEYKFLYLSYDNEIDMLNDFFFNYVKNATAISGWNFFGYDFMYLYNRAVILGIDITSISPSGSWFKYSVKNRSTPTMINLPRHKLIYDYMEIYVKWDRTISPKESNKLDWVAERALGVKKVVHQLGFKDMWEQTPEDYVFYNAIDSVLVREIDNKIRTSAAFYGLANLMHVDALTAFSPVRSLEIVQCEYLYRENKVFPSGVNKKQNNDEGYEGAFVYEPVPGIYKNVSSLDYASLYPHVIMQFNISPDTFLGKDKNHKITPVEIKTTSGAIYRNDIEGFIPRILSDIFNQRKAYKKEMKVAIQEKYDLKEILEKRLDEANQKLS